MSYEDKRDLIAEACEDRDFHVDEIAPTPDGEGWEVTFTDGGFARAETPELLAKMIRMGMMG